MVEAIILTIRRCNIREIKIGPYTVNRERIFLRTSDNGRTSHGFHRKPVGQWNRAEDWTGEPSIFKCGGFFGIDNECYSFGIIPNPTLELCEWRGERVPIDGNKICVSEFRVVAVNENIPDRIVKGLVRIVRDGDEVARITRGSWFVLGGKIGRISGGETMIAARKVMIREITSGKQWFVGKVSAGRLKITEGEQWFLGRSTAGNAEFSGGYQIFRDHASAGKATIIGRGQSFHDDSTAGRAIISGGAQIFYDRTTMDRGEIRGGEQWFHKESNAGQAKITGGIQLFSDKSRAGKARINGGNQVFDGKSTADRAEITGGEQDFFGESTAGRARISGGRQIIRDEASPGKAEITGGEQKTIPHIELTMLNCCSRYSSLQRIIELYRVGEGKRDS